MTKEEILKNALSENVKYIKLQFTDMLGTIKSVEIPLSKLEDSLDGKTMFDGSSIEGFVRIKEADMYLKPDYDTWIILPDSNDSKNERMASIICDVYLPNGLPFPGDSRILLKKSLAKLKERGFDSFKIGVEPEFYLFKKECGKLSFSDHSSYFDVAPIDSSEKFRRQIVLELERLGFQVEASHHEVGPGQNEINFKYDDALKTCDRIQMYKQVVKQVAERNGLIATFMPKPFDGFPGNGMHLNCSLMDENKQNLFYDENDPMKLSLLCRKWITGILLHSREISLITNPTVNSYKRLVPGFEAPCYICWSDANRSAMIRIPSIRKMGTRCEIRNVDPSCNPYLAAIAILEAGLDGIDHDYQLIEPVYDNIYELNENQRKQIGVNNLPENLKEAIDEFKNSSFMKEIFHEHLFDKYIQAKELEWESYRVLVHEWELKRYL